MSFHSETKVEEPAVAGGEEEEEEDEIDDEEFEEEGEKQVPFLPCGKLSFELQIVGSTLSQIERHATTELEAIGFQKPRRRKSGVEAVTTESGADVSVLVFIPYLKDLCIDIILRDFVQIGNSPLLDKLNKNLLNEIMNRLTDTLPLTEALTLISDETFWERLVRGKYKSPDPSEHGGSWKRMYVESHVRNLIESFVPDTEDPNDLKHELEGCGDFVICLKIRSLKLPEDNPDIHPESLEDYGADIVWNHLNTSLFLPILQNLQELDIILGLTDVEAKFERSMLQYTNQDCIWLAKSISMLPQLTILKLSNSGLTDLHIHKLASALAPHGCIKEVFLGYNDFGNIGAIAFAKVLLSEQCNLKVLILKNNMIEYKGAKALATALKFNTRLTTLDLSLNVIKDEGAKALLTALMDNQTLQNLDISANKLTESSAMELVKLIEHSDNFRQIFCFANNFNETSGDALREAISKKDNLKFFDVRLCNIGDDNEEMITKIVRTNYIKGMRRF